eukprot:COSAG02_NODE_33835_length_493_cov_1.418782_1_plen_47_part_10
MAAEVLALLFGHVHKSPWHVPEHDHQVDAIGDKPVETRVDQVKTVAQ